MLPHVRSPLTDRVDAYRARILAEDGDSERARQLAVHLRHGRRRSIVEIRCHLAENNGGAAGAILEQRPPRTALRALNSNMSSWTRASRSSRLCSATSSSLPAVLLPMRRL